MARNDDVEQRLPRYTMWAWLLAATVGACGLALGHGFNIPPVDPQVVRALLLASIVIFTVSRILIVLSPPGGLANLRTCWVDVVLIAAAIAWWAADHTRESAILHVGAAYTIATGAAAAARRMLGGIIDRPAGRSCGLVMPMVAIALIAATVGTAVLALPVCWAGPYPIDLDHPKTLQRSAEHVLSCFFTATAALTGTGLSAHDIGREFTPVGWGVLLALMEVGLFAVLALGSIAAWRLRAMMGWAADGDEASPGRLRRGVAAVCIGAILIQLAGAGALYMQTDVGKNAAPRSLVSLFHAAGALGNVGLTLEPDGFVGQPFDPALWSVILPLMLLGSIGGPVLRDVMRRLHPSRSRALSPHARLALGSTLFLILGGTALIFAIETTTSLQLRYPREDNPGHRADRWTTSADGTAQAVAPTTRPARSERMRDMPIGSRACAAFVHNLTARTGGIAVARLDEPSASPATRLVLMASMLTGGGLGGTAGGVRVMVVLILLAGLPGHRRGSNEIDPDNRTQATAAAHAALLAMLVIIAVAALIFVFRQPPSMERSVFEVVSATCNVGLSTGVTSELAVASLANRIVGQLALIAAMLLGRAVPLAILLGAVRNVRDVTPASQTESAGSAIPR